MQEVETAVAEAVERLRSQIEADAESMRHVLTADSDALTQRLDAAKGDLQQQLDSLNALATRCSDVSTTASPRSIHIR